jgi:hypothetical protein
MQMGIPGWLALFYVLWICAPMVPAILIYALFPKQPIGVKGPLGTLTVSATGAFAAYVIVFALAFPIVRNTEESLRALMHPIWTVSAKAKLVDENGNNANPVWFQGLNVELRPTFYSTANESVTIYVPQVTEKLPDILLSIPKFGSGTINLSDPGLAIDDHRKTISVHDPVVISKFPVQAAGVAADHP